ncbi:LLM class flavin-dependent oxidoreductase [Streptomyces sp. DSM 44915]|uniref:LLM class flavin-dependent oxidoreductase n=1 Tax=Streptomyces chisholmiae TaxID=3075540 RepID=A0ABU2JN87_9ACTN|nr:LLM class flavin-dependent oxidoreductase [Streptomyces sp. DSM 44915]MDT0266450.1 LLM class flavin-dependent oxidoreductase [Streptomyces sp. DSM 44915]
MSTESVPLSVLDLVPVSSGGDAATALRNTVDLARHVEEWGYHRYWLAEHHLAAGVASSQPALVIGLVAGATSRLRVGSGAVQLGYPTAVSVVEQFGTLDAIAPGRIDLGLGRAGHRPARARPADQAGQPSQLSQPGQPAPAGPEPAPPARSRVVGGLLIPPPFAPGRLLSLPRFVAQQELLRPPDATPRDYAEQVDEIRALLAGTFRTPDGHPVHVVPGEGAALQLWVLGSSGGESARVAGARGLPFTANYHVSPGTILETVAAYRAAFVPTEARPRPYLQVSADVVIADEAATARRLAAGYAPWVRAIRTGRGAIPFPTPAEADALSWTDEERALVADRLDTQFVGDPDQVVAGLRRLVEVTGADELLVTTVTHEHADRLRSYRLLAEAWGRSG